MLIWTAVRKTMTRRFSAEFTPHAVARPQHYSSVKGTFEASLPTGQFALSTTALPGLR